MPKVSTILHITKSPHYKITKKLDITEFRQKQVILVSRKHKHSQDKPNTRLENILKLLPYYYLQNLLQIYTELNTEKKLNWAKNPS